MTLAINVIDRLDPNNKMHHQLQPKKTKVYMCSISHFYIAAKRCFTCSLLLTRRNALALMWQSIKRRLVHGVALPIKISFTAVKKFYCEIIL